MRVLVLTGGNTAEIEPSLDNGRYAAELLRSYDDLEVEVLDLRLDDESRSTVLALKPDVIFNAQIGGDGENGRVQAFLDTLGIPYTHSGADASALAFDKINTKAVAMLAGVPVMPTYLVARRDELLIQRHRLLFPCVIKPVRSGSSLGVLICRTAADLTEDALLKAGPRGELVMVEHMADTSRDFTVAVFNDEAMAVSENVVNGYPFYSYEAKTDWYGSITRCPADLPAEAAMRMRAMALAMHRKLGCRGLTRSDFMLDGGQARFLEINVQPVLNDRSLYTDWQGRERYTPREFVRAILDACIPDGRP